MDWNTLNPLQKLLRSRKFWLMVLDVVVSVTLYFVTAYASPEAQEHVKFLIGVLQPVFVVLIGAIAYEDANYMPDVASLQVDPFDEAS